MSFDNFIKNLKEYLNIAGTHFDGAPWYFNSKQREASFEQSLELTLLLFILCLLIILINNGKNSWSNINNFVLIYNHPPILVYRVIVPHNVSANFTNN